MNKIKILFYTFFLCLGSYTTIGFCELQSNEPNNNTAYFNKIEQSITNKDTLDTDKIDVYKQELRELQKTLQDNILKLEEEKKTEVQHLEALGAAPNRDKGEEESEQVSQIRKQFNDKIIAIDGQIKKEQLEIVRSDDLLNTLNSIQQDKIQSRLIERIPSPFMPSALLNASTQSIAFIQNMYARPVIIGFIILLLLLNLVSFPILRLLKKKQQEFTRISLGNIKHRLAVQLIFSSIIILGLRFSDLETHDYNALRHLSQALASILLSLSLYEFLNKIQFVNTYDTEQDNYVSPFWVSVKNKVKILILLFIPLSVIGFTEFASYFVFNIFTLIMAVILFIFCRFMAIQGLFAIESLKKDTAVKSYRDLYASAPAILIIEPMIALLTVFFALFFWGLDTTELQAWADKYSNGIPIGQFTLNFGDIWASIISFLVIYVIFRMVIWFLSSRVFPKTTLDTGIVNAILTVLGYSGFIFATLSAGSALGFDASNIAIVAGALSVGIGFGLQTIFSNFVSGLILLFERPFKVGDLVMVNEFEGLIRKISVRSTEIETFQKSSVIVPNSKMISDVVINRTLHNARARVDIKVGVAYNSNIKQVIELLVECTKNHKMILKNPEAHVLFMNFGESSLDFELRCYVTNVHDAVGVGSDLRFMIFDKFKQHNIQIPFPQRDLYIHHTKDIPITDI